MMAIRGRPPLATAKLKQRDNWQAAKHALRVEGVPAAMPAMPPPRHLSKGAAALWPEMYAKVTAIGVLTDGDMLALEQLCEMASMVRRMSSILEIEGYSVESRDGPKPNPMIPLFFRCQQRLFDMLTHFGLTPVSRNRAAVVEAKDNDPLDAFVN